MVEFTGLTLGRYLVLDPLNDPYQSDVFLVEQTQTGIKVAARIYTALLRRDGVDSERESQQFFARAAAIVQSQHENILPILDFGEQEAMRYMIVPSLRDGTLADYIKSGEGQPLPLPLNTITSLIGPLATALQYLHDHGISHGNVDLRTLLVRRLPTQEMGTPHDDRWLDPRQIELVLSDFGLERFFGDSFTSPTGPTIDCAAPEARRGMVTPAADQYSLACVAYVLLTGRPHESESPDGLQGHPARRLVPPSHVNPRIPVAVDAVFATALQADLTLRYPRVLDFAYALMAALNTARPATPETGEQRGGPASEVPLSRRQALINVVGSIGVGLAVATGITYVAFAPRQRLPASATSSSISHPGDSIGFFRPTAQTFFLMSSLASKFTDIALVFGGRSGLPIAGNWSGDGIDAIGIFTPEIGTFSLLAVNKPPAKIAYTIVFGTKSDIPLAGDWTGKGHDGIGVFRPSDGTFYLKNTLDDKPPDFIINMGRSGDIPVVGDWNGDGIDGIGVYRPSLDTFFLTDTVCNLCAREPNYSVSLGIGAGLPLAGNWLGQAGRSGLGIFLPSAGMVFLKKDPTHLGPPDYRVVYGKPGDLPVAGHWMN